MKRKKLTGCPICGSRIRKVSGLFRCEKDHTLNLFRYGGEDYVISPSEDEKEQHHLPFPKGPRENDLVFKK